MLHWIIYDITSNKLRSKVANKCKNYGMIRVQKSAFLGELTQNKAEMLSLEIHEVLGKSKDAVFIFPSCKECFADKIIEGYLDEEFVKKKDFLIIGDEHGKKVLDSN